MPSRDGRVRKGRCDAVVKHPLIRRLTYVIIFIIRLIAGPGGPFARRFAKGASDEARLSEEGERPKTRRLHPPGTAGGDFHHRHCRGDPDPDGAPNESRW